MNQPSIKVFSHGHRNIQRFLLECGIEDCDTTKPKVGKKEYVVEYEAWKFVWKTAVPRTRPWAVRMGKPSIWRDTTFAFSFHATLEAAIAAANRYAAADAANAA